MKLTLDSFFVEPDYYFNISYHVSNYIIGLLDIHIMEPYELSQKDQNLFLSLIISTNSKTKVVEVKGPSYDKRNGFINYGLWLPYKPITQSENYLSSYLKYLFDSLVIVFSKYSVKEEDVRKVQKLVEEEVLDNPKYGYVDENNLPPPDLSDIVW